MNISTLVTLLASFCLSTVAYIVAQPDYIPVQHIEFDDYYVYPRVQTYDLGDYEIRVIPDQSTFIKIRDEKSSGVIEMEEEIIIAQEGEEDDGDGANIDWMNDNWCLIHPDDELCQEDTKGDEEEGC